MIYYGHIEELRKANKGRTYSRHKLTYENTSQSSPDTGIRVVISL